MIVILDFGSQYTQLIARRIREANVYCEIHPYHISLDKLKQMPMDGLILSGGPASVRSEDAPALSFDINEITVPILGICYGLQLLTKGAGGEIVPSHASEYGKTKLTVIKDSLLLQSIPQNTAFNVWMSHGDTLISLPKDFISVASSEKIPYAALQHISKPIYAIQFHPEVTHSENGKQILSNFLFAICKVTADWKMDNFIEQKCEEIKAIVQDKKVICGLSGGVDSSVVAILLEKAIGKQVTCIFIDNGLLRKNEAQNVVNLFSKHYNLNFIHVNAQEKFLSKLANVTDPEQKRKIIGHTFIEVFDEEAKKIENATFLAQGTLYPDVIESISAKGPSAVIKSHHNVGGLPDKMKLSLLEPLRELFKDEVRLLGKALAMPDELVYRHPFPGPGLAVRILGDITKQKIATLQEADAIVLEELKRANYYHKVWQAFAVLLPVRTVGVMGDSRTYAKALAIRSVESTDGMTANWSHLPYELLGTISNRIINEVADINRIVYDITTKPPGTIEWE